MEQQKVTLAEFLDLLGRDALALLNNIQSAKDGAKKQAETIDRLEAKVKELEAEVARLKPPPPSGSPQ